MKKAQVLMLGTVILGSALFGNSAFAKEKEESASFFNSFSSQVAPAPQTVVLPQTWTVTPVEGQTVTPVVEATAQKGWAQAPLEGQAAVTAPVQTMVHQGWSVVPAEGQTTHPAQPAVAVQAWTVAPAEDAPGAVISGNQTASNVQYGWSYTRPEVNSDKE